MLRAPTWHDIRQRCALLAIRPHLVRLAKQALNKQRRLSWQQRHGAVGRDAAVAGGAQTIQAAVVSAAMGLVPPLSWLPFVVWWRDNAAADGSAGAARPAGGGSAAVDAGRPRILLRGQPGPFGAAALSSWAVIMPQGVTFSLLARLCELVGGWSAALASSAGRHRLLLHGRCPRVLWRPVQPLG